MAFLKSLLNLAFRNVTGPRLLLALVLAGLTAPVGAQTNLPPTITTITNRTILEDGGTGAIAFTIGDAESNPNQLQLTRASSNTDLVPLANIVFGGGSDATRNVTITPVPDASGTSDITIAVSDGTNTASTIFTLTVAAVNDSPTISTISDRDVQEDGTTGAIAFTVADIDSPVGGLTLTGNSSAPSLVAVSGINFGGAGANRTVTVTPLPDQNGTATITITVSDGATNASTSFTITVTPANDAPRITGSVLTNITDSAPSLIFANLTLSDVDDGNPSNETLVVTVSLTNNPAIGSFGDGVTTLSFTNRPASLTTALRAQEFFPAFGSSAPVGGTNFTVQIALRDSSVNSPDNGPQTVTLFGENDPPTLAVTATPAAFLDNLVVQPFFVSAADPDVDDVLTLEILPVNDTNFSFGVLDPANPQFTGSPAAIESAVRNVFYRPLRNAVATNQNVEFRFRLRDDGGNETNRSVTLTIQGINDVPDIIGVSLESLRIRDDATTLPFAGVRIEDPDQLGEQLVTVFITLDDSGKGTFDGPTVLSNVTPAVATTNLSNLRFTPTPNRVPVGQTELVGLTIRVVDALGAQRVDNRASILVTSVNSAPQIAGVLNSDLQPKLLPPTGTIFPFAGISITDDDQTNLTVTVALDNPAKGTLISPTNLVNAFVETAPGSGVYTLTGLSNVVTTALTNLQFLVNTNFLFPPSAPGGTTFTLTAVDPQLNTTVATLAIVVQFDPGNWLVTRREDDLLPGSLRHAIVNAENNAVITIALGDYPAEIRLKTELGPMECIRNLTVKGPGADKLTITGDADGNGTPDLQLFRVHAGVTFEGVTLTRGTASTGGAVYVGPDGNLTLRYCALTANRATEYGGAVDVEEGRLTAEHCLFFDNSTDAALGVGGGAVSLYTAQLCVVRNTTFSGNRQRGAAGRGGSVYAENFDPMVLLPVEISHCTFTGNEDVGGGGSSVHGNVFGTWIELLNCIFADGQDRNLEAKGAAQIVSLGGNLSDDAAQTVLTQGGQPQAVAFLDHPSDAVLVNPLLAPLAFGRGPMAAHALLAGSPAINRGVVPPMGSRAESTDQNGVIRDAQPDSGAAEFGRTARIVLNEIQTQAGATNFIEFYVLRDSSPVDLSGYSVWLDQTNRHVFGPGTVIQPGFGLVLVANTNVPITSTNNPTRVEAASTTNLPLQAQGVLELRGPNTNNRPVLSIGYLDRFIEPTGFNTNFPGNSQTLVPQFGGFAFVPHKLVLPPPLGGADLGRQDNVNIASPGSDTSPTPFGLPNAFPLAAPDELLVKEDDVVTLDVLANDLDADGLDRLVIVHVSQTPSGGSNEFAVAVTQKGAALTVTPAGLPVQGEFVVFDPLGSTNLQRLAEGAKTTDEFYYSIIDYGSGSVLDYTNENGGLALVSPAHRLKVGDEILLAGVAVSNYLGLQVVTNVLDDDRFSVGVEFLTNPPVKGSWVSVAPRDPTERKEARVTLTVLGANDPPLPAGDELFTGEETVLRIFSDATLAGNTNLSFASDAQYPQPRTVSPVSLLSNDLDPDTDDDATTLTIVGVLSQPNPITNYLGTAGASPVVVQAPAHGLASGTVVLVANYGGHPTYNGYHPVIVIDANTFSIPVSFVDNHPQKGVWVVLDDANRLTATSLRGAGVVLEIRANRSETSVIYNPRNSDFLNRLSSGEQENDQFFYAVRDRHNAISLAPVTVTVTGVNDAPVPTIDPGSLAGLTNGTPLSNVLSGLDVLYALPAASGAANRVDAEVNFQSTSLLLTNLWTTREDQALPISAASLLANDADVDRNDVLEIQSVSAFSREGAAVTLSGDGSTVQYDPAVSTNLNQLAREELLLDSFDIVVTDDRGGAVLSTVAVLVEGVNDTPVAVDDFLSTFANQLLLVGPPGLLTNDIEPDINGVIPDDQLRLLNAGPTNTAAGGIYQIISNTLSYNPTMSGTFAALGVGQTFLDSFPYSVADTSLLFADEDRFQVAADGSNYELRVLANDRDFTGSPGVLKVQSLGPPNRGGTVAISADGTRVIYTPEVNFFGDEVFTYTAINEQGNTDRGLVLVRVVVPELNGNLLAGFDRFSVAKGESPLLDVLANDNVLPAGGAGLVITRIVTAPTLDPLPQIDGGKIRYVQQFAGPFPYEQTFSYEISGGGTARAIATVTVRIVDREGTLNIRDDAFSVQAGSLDNALDVLVNDNLLPGTGAALQILGQPVASHGQVTVSGDAQALLYTPNPGFVGEDSFGYTASDNLGGTGTGLVRVVVGSLATSGDFFAVPFDASGITNDNGLTELDVLANDPVLQGAGGTNVLITAVNPATSPLGTLSIQPGSRRLGFDPAEDQTGEQEFTYTISDGLGGTATERFTVIIAGSGLKANSDNFTVPLNSSVTLFNVLANDLAIPDQGRVISVVSIGSGADAPNQGGVVSISAAGDQLEYTPAAGFTGVETFTYTITDSFRVDTAKVVVRVTSGELSANDDAFTVFYEVLAGTTNQARTFALPVLGNDLVVPDLGQVLTITGVGINSTAATNAPDRAGVVEIAPDGFTLLYTPGDADGPFPYSERFTYEVGDGTERRAEGVVMIEVQELTNIRDLDTADDRFHVTQDSQNNALPVLLNDNVQPATASGWSITGVSPGNLGGLVAISGTNLIYTPVAGLVGEDQFSYTVSDGFGGTGTATVTVRVGGVVLNEDRFSTLSGSVSNQLDVLANDGLLPLEGVNYQLLSAGSADRGGEVTVTNGLVFYTPLGAGPFPYVERFSYVVADASLALVTGRVSVVVVEAGADRDAGVVQVSVLGVNDPPVISGMVTGQTVYLGGAVRPFSTVTVTDIDYQGDEPLVIRVSVNPANHGVLVAPAGLVDEGGGRYRLGSPGSGLTPAAASMALREVAFLPTTAGRVTPGGSETTRMVLEADDLNGGIATNDQTTVVTLTARVAKLTPSGLLGQSQFGTAVAASRDLVVVGLPAAFSQLGIVTGVVHVYERVPGSYTAWNLVKVLQPSTQLANSLFGLSVAISGDTILVGAPGDSAGGIRSGVAYLFARDAGGADAWGLVKRLEDSAPQNLQQFGTVVSVDGEFALVGAPNDSVGAAGSGSASLFKRDEGGASEWGLVRKLLADAASSGDQFGNAVSVSDNTVVVGASLANPLGADSGAAYVFERDQGGAEVWGLVQRLTPDDGLGGDKFGTAAAVSDGTIMVGSPFDDESQGDSGSVYVFERTGGGTNLWQQTAKLVAPQTAANALLGSSLSFSRNFLLAGAPGGSGVVHVFRRGPYATAWTAVDALLPDNPQAGSDFGRAVALGGFTAAVGARFERVSGSLSGAVHLYRLLFNNPPAVLMPPGDVSVTTGVPFQFALPPDTFADPDVDDELIWMADGLPAWLGFTSSNHTFSGTSPVSTNQAIQIAAMDLDGATAATSFVLRVVDGGSGLVEAVKLQAKCVGGGWQVSYERLKANSAATFVLEYSPNLTQWQPATAFQITETFQSIDALRELVVLEIVPPAALTGSWFFRGTLTP